MALNVTNYSFDIDMVPKGFPPVAPASQGDVGRAFVVNLYWNGTPWTPANGTTCKVRGKKPDKTVFNNDATIGGSTVTFTTTEQMTIIDGKVECELAFENGTQKIATANFYLLVEGSAYNPDAPSTSDISGIGEDAIEDGAITIDKLDPAVKRAIYNWHVIGDDNTLEAVEIDNTDYPLKATKLNSTQQTNSISTDSVTVTRASGSIVSIPYPTFVNAVLTRNGVGTGRNITDAWYNGTLKEEVEAGNFSNVNIGDVITGQSSGHNYVVVDLDYFWDMGATGSHMFTRHIVLMTARTNEDGSSTGKINSTASTAGGFKASTAFTTDLPAYADGILTDDFGDNLLEFPVYVSNAVTDGKASGAEWVNVKAMIPNEVQVVGHNSFGNAYDTGACVYKFRLFDGWRKNAYFGNTSLRCCDIVNNSQYSAWSLNGYFVPLNANQSSSIKPYFCLGVSE